MHLQDLKMRLKIGGTLPCVRKWVNMQDLAQMEVLLALKKLIAAHIVQTLLFLLYQIASFHKRMLVL